MIIVYLIQACLFILGAIPFLCEISRHFTDSFFTMICRFIIFLLTLVCGFYAPLLQTLPNVIIGIVALVLLFLSYSTLNDILNIYRNKRGLKNVKQCK